MIEKEYKIKVTKVVDDSQEKKYYSESESRRKKSTAQETEEEKRKTATIKAELNTRYAQLKQALDRELEAEKQGNRLEIKEAIQKRKILESELRTFEAANRNSLSIQLADFKAAKQKELIEARKNLSEFRNAPRTNLRGAIGSEAYVSQLIGAQKKMQVGSSEFNQTGVLIDRYQTSLKGANREVKSLSRQIGGELNSALKKNNAALMEGASNFIKFNLTLAAVTIGARKFWDILNKGADLQVTRDNFQGTTEDIKAFETATSNTVAKASLMKLSSQATDLGISLRDQTVLFSLAETAGDKYGGSVEENFQGLVNSTEGATKVLKTLGVQKKVYEETIKSMLPEGVKELDQLDAEAQKRIRVEALLKVSGETYDTATKKLMDNKDMLESTTIFLENFQAALGDKAVDMFAGMIKDATDTLNNFGIGTDEATGFLGKFTEKFLAHLDILVKVLLPWTNLIKIVKTASESFSKITLAVKDTNSALGSIVSLLGKPVPTPLIDGIKEALQFAQEEARAFLRILGLITAKGGNNDAMGVVGNGEGDRGKKGFIELPKKKETGSNKSGSTNNEQEQITFLEELRKRIADLQIEIGALNKDLADTNLKEYERLRIEERLIEKRQELNDLIRETVAIANGQRSAVGGDKPIAKGAGTPKNPNAYNDPRGDMTSEELQGIQLSFQEIKGIADSLITPFQNILSLAGLTESEFGKMLQMIQGLFNAGSSVFDIFSTVLSFIPGGSVVSGVLSGGGAGGALNGGMPRGMSFNPTVIVQSEVEKHKATRFYGNTLPEYNRRQSVKAL